MRAGTGVWNSGGPQLSLEYAIRSGIKVGDASFSRNFHRFQVSSRQRHLQDGNLAHATLDREWLQKVYIWLDPLAPRSQEDYRSFASSSKSSRSLHMSPLTSIPYTGASPSLKLPI